jgi:hypothetical protein
MMVVFARQIATLPMLNNVNDRRKAEVIDSDWGHRFLLWVDSGPLALETPSDCVSAEGGLLGPWLGRRRGTTFLRRFVSDKDCIFRETLGCAEVPASSDVRTIAFGVRQIVHRL